MKKLLILSIAFLQLFSGELYFLPFESHQALSKLLRWIDHSRSSIDIAMYSFTNAKIAKRIKNAAKRGVRVRVILDKDQNLKDRYSKIGYLAKYKNIRVYTLSGKRLRAEEHFGKMHQKLAIIDHKRLVFGSANWSNSAFKRNYELLYFLESYPQAKKATKFFELMLKRAHPY